MARYEPRIILTAAGFLLLQRYEATVHCARGKKSGDSYLAQLVWMKTDTATAPSSYNCSPGALRSSIHTTHSNAAQPHRIRTRAIHLNERNRQSANRLPLVQRENPSHPNATINHHTITVYLARPHNHRISRRQTSGLMVMEGQKDTL